MLKDLLFNLVWVIIMAAVVDIILPEGNMRKYARVALGFLMVAVFLTPLVGYLASGQVPNFVFESGAWEKKVKPSDYEDYVENLIKQAESMLNFDK